MSSPSGRRAANSSTSASRAARATSRSLTPWPSAHEVLAQRAFEQHGVLGDHRDLAAQVVQLVVADVDAVDEHGAVVDVEQARDERGDRGLAGARRADEGDGLAGLDAQRQVVEHRPAAVGERDVAQLDGATDRDRHGRRGGRRCRAGRRALRRSARDAAAPLLIVWASFDSDLIGLYSEPM